MTKAQNVTPSAITNVSKRPSLIAKCVAPFAAKQRNNIEQEIQLDEPFRQYAPGDRIKGAIHVNVGRPIRVTHLVIRLHGFVKVFNRAKGPGEEIACDESLSTSGKGRRRRGIEYLGNGYARLFEDEVTLCGEGRLHGPVKFCFDMALPSKNIPSSIDFEHGTIAYFISSTVTRPVTIAPTSTQHFKLHVQEAVDIALIKKPTPVDISMEVSTSKGKQAFGGKTGLPSESERTSKSSSQCSTNNTPITRNTAISEMEEPPRSPVPSVISSNTATTGSASSNPLRLQESPSCISSNGGESLTTISDLNKVNAKTEVLQGGCLAGDALPLKISIKHKKPVKNMQGIIVTLYRQGRIDTHPAIPVGPFRKGEKRRYEDYYPRSLTGLSGLSLSSAGSSRSFRQDLNQIFVPLITHPHSLDTVVNTSIQAPADLFPSITAVPGAMVSFKYFVEIVIDLRSRLSGQDRIRPHLSMTSAPQHGYGDPKVSRCEGSEGVSYLSTPGFNYLITDQLRRTRGVVSTRTEIIIGTRDSARKRSKTTDSRSALTKETSLQSLVDLGREEDPENLSVDDDPYIGDHEAQSEQRHLPSGLDNSQVPMMPLPEPEEELDEKAQIRRAEQSLLPSAPPIDENRSSSAAIVPTAPPAIDEEDFIHRYTHMAPAPAYGSPPTLAIDSRLGDQYLANGHDDKQELERQRLLALASSPEEDDGEPDSAGNNTQANAPSAPVLFEDDVFNIEDPREPESPPADFAADRVSQHKNTEHSEPFTEIEEDIANSTETPQQSRSADEDRIHDDLGNYENFPQDDHDLHNDVLPVYRR